MKEIAEQEYVKIADRVLRRQVCDFLSDFITTERLSRIQEVLNNRTRHVTVVIEDLYQTQNISAVLRTCECYGIQDVHVVQHEHEFQVHKAISMGANKWLTIHQYQSQQENITEKIAQLKKQGYTTVATLPSEDSLFLQDLPVEEPTAFFFGTELKGLSKEMIEMADKTIKIPMYGFTESFNISNSVAITLSNFVEKMRKSNVNWNLSVEEKEELYFEWLQKSVKAPQILVKNFLK